jgi:hypothetical protein
MFYIYAIYSYGRGERCGGQLGQKPAQLLHPVVDLCLESERILFADCLMNSLQLYRGSEYLS